MPLDELLLDELDELAATDELLLDVADELLLDALDALDELLLAAFDELDDASPELLDPSAGRSGSTPYAQ